MSVSQPELAWAAGLFDGEGSSSMFLPRRRLTARRQLQVSQAGTLGEPPEVLVRFQAIVGVGNVTGPYRAGLFYWKTTRKDAVDAVAIALWPYLGVVKRAQFEAMTVAAGRRLPQLPALDRASDTELAWAAGLFDGEGSIFIRRTRRGSAINLEVSQAGGNGMPETLSRFREAVGAGWLNGPYPPRSPWTRLPFYRWTLGSRAEVERVLTSLWPFLSSARRERLSGVQLPADQPRSSDLITSPAGTFG